jgi:hypothetical protein
MRVLALLLLCTTVHSMHLRGAEDAQEPSCTTLKLACGFTHQSAPWDGRDHAASAPTRAPSSEDTMGDSQILDISCDLAGLAEWEVVTSAALLFGALPYTLAAEVSTAEQELQLKRIRVLLYQVRAVRCVRGDQSSVSRRCCVCLVCADERWN